MTGPRKGPGVDRSSNSKSTPARPLRHGKPEHLAGQ